jgi:hypothetical protein
MLVLLCLVGCSQRPAWHDNPAAAKPQFWFDEAASVRVFAEDYDALWRAANQSLSRFDFDIDLSDYRSGRLTTFPKDSGLIIEPWRDEQRTLADRLESTVAPLRRTVRFDFAEAAGDWYVEPRVVVEKEARPEGPRRRVRDEQRPAFGWFAVGRDTALEASLANFVAERAAGRVVKTEGEQRSLLQR